MALSVKDPVADRLAREVAARTVETLTTAVIWRCVNASPGCVVGLGGDAER
jgi:hypothetical protein